MEKSWAVEGPACKIKLEYLFTYTLLFPPGKGALPMGELPTGEGMVFSIVENCSAVRGPRVNGEIISGEDWMSLGCNGVAFHDVRCIIKTNDGALIDYRYKGRSDWGQEGYETFRKEGKVPEGLRIIGAPLMMTSHPKYEWLNRCQCVNVGEIQFEKERYVMDIYAVL